MGAWGVAVFSDDLAADVRGDFRELIGNGLTSTEAVDQLIREYAESLEDGDERAVFWIALAATQWKLGRLEDRTKREALHVIESGADLVRWDQLRERTKRAAVLEKLREELLSPPPPEKRVAKTHKAANAWHVGEIIGFRLLSGKWILLRVLGYHVDKGGRNAVCELLDWVGREIPSAEAISEFSIRRSSGKHDVSQFFFQEPRKKQDQSRVVRLGIRSTPAQKCGGYAVFVWPYVDQLLEDIFKLK